VKVKIKKQTNNDNISSSSLLIIINLIFISTPQPHHTGTPKKRRNSPAAMTTTFTSSASSGRLYLDALKVALALAKQHQADLLRALSNDELPAMTHALQSLLAALGEKQEHRPAPGLEDYTMIVHVTCFAVLLLGLLTLGCLCVTPRKPRRRRCAAVSPPDAKQHVLMNEQLLIQIFTYLLEDGPRTVLSRKALGRCGLVNRLWRDVSCLDLFWQSIVAQLLPLTYQLGGNLTEERSDGGAGSKHRVHLLTYGKMLMERESRLRDPLELLDMNLYVDIFDSRIQFFVVTQPFSATSRDFERRGFANLEQLFLGVDIAIRVMVRNWRTGVEALIYESGPRNRFIMFPLSQSPEVYNVSTIYGNPVFPIQGPLPVGIVWNFAFLLRLADGQNDDVPASHKMWQVGGQHNDFGLSTTSPDHEVMTFLCSLLA
jgi:hypothetical protein